MLGTFCLPLRRHAADRWTCSELVGHVLDFAPPHLSSPGDLGQRVAEMNLAWANGADIGGRYERYQDQGRRQVVVADDAAAHRRAGRSERSRISLRSQGPSGALQRAALPKSRRHQRLSPQYATPADAPILPLIGETSALRGAETSPYTPAMSFLPRINAKKYDGTEGFLVMKSA